MSVLETAVLVTGALCGGFASGLTGFGYSMVSLGIWLHLMGPQTAVPLCVLCSVASQALTLPRIWPTIDWRRSAPFIVAGMAGIPVGVVLLAMLDAGLFKRVLGLFLVAYASVILLLDVHWESHWGGAVADAAVGVVGGILGGIGGLSGSIMVVWAAIRGWGKADKRAIFQAFNASMLAGSAVMHAWHGLHTRTVGGALLIAAPLSIAAASLGHRLYLRMSAQRFDRAVLWLLLIAGLGLLAAPQR